MNKTYRIRPLVWVPHISRRDKLCASGMAGYAYAWPHAASSWVWEWRPDNKYELVLSGICDSLDAAKLAAEAAYIKRIEQALEPAE